ncbi:MAG: copper resistance system multicopper oxidase [Proteobacteria bacterium]|nr:copper resistance system multicopper oxidase [Pseudomonadota bacterium]
MLQNNGFKKKWPLRRRQFLQGAGAVGLLAALEGLAPNYAGQLVRAANGAEMDPEGLFFNLDINHTSLDIGGKDAHAITVNGTIPGPLIRLKEGQMTTMAVTNHLKEDTSIHWHGILVPPGMDGVPGVSFAGIRPGETFTYNFPVKQSGTYWYHSHSGLQEQLGHFGPLIIDPVEPDPFSYDREYVVMLSDWTFENPYRVLAKLKKQSDYYNFQKRTVGDFFKDVSEKGFGPAFAERKMWAKMRMSATDFADISGYTYTYLMNGRAPVSNWTGRFRPGEKIRLRFINAAAMTYFDLRIPGLKMTVVQADGQNVQPVMVDEFRIGAAETYDVIIEPKEDRAYTIFAESMDRSGYAAGTLAPREGMTAPLPERRKRPVLSMADMGMAGMADMGMGGMAMKGMDGMDMKGMDGMKDMKMDMKSEPVPIKRHGPDKHGPGNTMVAEMPRNRLGDPGVGLENTGTRVLVYNDLRSIAPGYDKRAPEREIELHLTGNMERYMWSFDGKKFSEAKGPIEFRNGERLRLTMINDTMMSHPIHLHGMWMELDNGAGEFRPRKHTVNVKPAEQLSVIISVDAPGNWAFHCHLLYHMDMGMFRIVSVTDYGGETGS